MGHGYLFSQCAVHRVLCSTNLAGHSELVLMRWCWGPPGPTHSAQGIWWQGSNLCPHTPAPVLSSQPLVDSCILLKAEAADTKKVNGAIWTAAPSPGNRSRRPRPKQASSYPKQGMRSSKCVSKAKTQKDLCFEYQREKRFKPSSS